MSVLSDSQILSHIYQKKFGVEPLMVDHIQPSSIDLTLDDLIKIPKDGVTINSPYPSSEEIEKHYESVSLGSGFVLRPGQFVLAQVRETLSFSDRLVGSIQNRNSIIRMGINVGLSTYINPGYVGKLPIALHNVGKFDFMLTPGMRICQLLLHDTHGVISDYSKRKDAKYHGEESITLSKLSEDAEFVEYAKRAGSKANAAELVEFLKRRVSEKSHDFLSQLSAEQREVLGLA